MSKTKYFRLYAKESGASRFRPVDWSSGATVINLIYATLFPEGEAKRLRESLPELADLNPGWAFEVRPVSNG